MRKAIERAMLDHDPSIRFRSFRELTQAIKMWDWSKDGYIAYSRYSADDELAELAEENSLGENEYALTERI